MLKNIEGFWTVIILRQQSKKANVLIAVTETSV